MHNYINTDVLDATSPQSIAEIDAHTQCLKAGQSDIPARPSCRDFTMVPETRSAAAHKDKVSTAPDESLTNLGARCMEQTMRHRLSRTSTIAVGTHASPIISLVWNRGSPANCVMMRNCDFLQTLVGTSVKRTLAGCQIHFIQYAHPFDSATALLFAAALVDRAASGNDPRYALE